MTRRVPNWSGHVPPDRISPTDRGGARDVGRTGDEWATPGPVGSSTRVQATFARALTYGLWAALALALVLGLVNCAGAPSAAPPATEMPSPEPVPPPGGCAELTVAAWLAGDHDLLTGLVGLPRSQPELELRQVTRTYALSASPGIEPDSWVYVVAASVRERSSEDQPWQPADLQFFAITLVPSGTGCHGWSPATLPARVPPPQLAGETPPPYRIQLPHSDTPLSDTLTAFFAALLAGAGSIERYVAPGIAIVPFAPPPYAHVEVTGVLAYDDSPVDRAVPVPADGTVAQLLVTVSTDPEGANLPLVYPVRAAVRGGRWEVISIDPTAETTTSTPTPGT